MAFVVLHGKEDAGKWIECNLALGCAQTSLQGKKGRSVLAVPDFALEEMEKFGIAFTPIREDQLAEYLTPGGLDYYRLLQKVNPEFLYFNAPLPPALHVKLFCRIFEPHLNALRQIVERYEPVEFRTEEVCVETISLQSDQPSESQPMVRVEFTVPRKHQEALVNELMASGAAGTSRQTAIYVHSDPDGPPRRDSNRG
jgi:hypothetical protein